MVSDDVNKGEVELREIKERRFVEKQLNINIRSFARSFRRIEEREPLWMS